MSVPIEMSDSISISFQDAFSLESVAVFSSTMGTNLKELAVRYIEHATEVLDISKTSAPQIVTGFVAWLAVDNPWDDIMDNIYMGSNMFDGVNKDNGHYIIDWTGNIVSHYEGSA